MYYEWYVCRSICNVVMMLFIKYIHSASHHVITLMYFIVISLQVLELYCKEVQRYLSDSRICSISNSSSYVAMLMKAVCFFSPETELVNSDTVKRKRSIIDDGSINKTKQPSVVSYKQSKIRPVFAIDVKPRLSRQNSSPMVKSPISGLRQLYPLVAMDTVDGESDLSGYEGDTEFWTQRWWEGTRRYEQEEENEEGLVAGVGTSSLMSPLTPIKAPLEIKRRIWLETPLWQCIDLLEECLGDKETAEKWYVKGIGRNRLRERERYI